MRVSNQDAQSITTKLMIKGLIIICVIVGLSVSFKVFAITDEERNYCLQQSYDSQQIAENKLRGITKEQLLHFLAQIPSDSVPKGYIESNMLNVMEVYNMDFETPEEAQQKSLIKCLDWHKENGQNNELIF